MLTTIYYSCPTHRSSLGLSTRRLTVYSGSVSAMMGLKLSAERSAPWSCEGDSLRDSDHLYSLDRMLVCNHDPH